MEKERGRHEAGSSCCRIAALGSSRPSLRRRRRVAGEVGARPADQLVGAGATFPFPLISQWQKDYESKTGVEDRLQPDRLGRRHRRDHGPDGRLRRERRAADARPVQRPARAASRSRGCCRRPRSSTTCRASRTTCKMTGPVHREHLPRQDHEVERPGDQEAQPGGQPAGHEDHAGLPLRRLGHDVQLHRLPVVGQPGVQVEGRRLDAGQLPGRASAASGCSGVAGVVTNTEGAIGYADIAYALANKIKFMSRQEHGRQVRHARACARSRRRRRTIKKVPANNEMHIVNPPKAQTQLAYPICTFTLRARCRRRRTRRRSCASSSSTR